MIREMHRAAIASVRALGQGRWTLPRAREVARQVETHPPAVRAVVEVLFSIDAEQRKRAADVARRITEQSPEPLWKHADELAGLLADLDPTEKRTRWHLGLVVPRIAHTREQRLRAARLMQLLAEDDGNVVRCSAIEGLGLLACEEKSLREIAAEIAKRASQLGTRAEQCRARQSLQRLTQAETLSNSNGEQPELQERDSVASTYKMP